jgi:hypothetical protein
MKILKRLAAPLMGALLLCGCANQDDKAAMPVAEFCIMDPDNPVDADSPSSEFMGQTVRFCCDRCKGKFDAMDDAAKQAKLAEKK